MDLKYIAKILYSMSLDMDYADAIGYMQNEINIIAKELEILKKNHCDSTLQALETIACKNGDDEFFERVLASEKEE